MDLSDLQKNLKERAAEIDKEVKVKIATLSVLIDQAIVLATPVDTGRARSSWIVSLDEPVIREVSESEIDKTGTKAIKQAQDELSKYADGAGNTIHIVNNVVYIRTLNRGHSPQAKKNFILKAIRAAIRGAKQGGIID